MGLGRKRQEVEVVNLRDLELILKDSALETKPTEDLLSGWGLDPDSVAIFARNIASVDVPSVPEAFAVLVMTGFELGYRARMLVEERKRKEQENGTGSSALPVRGDSSAEG